MRAFLAACLVAASALAVGCTVAADSADDEGDSAESAGALSSYGKSIVGSWHTTDTKTDFDTLTLKSDGTFTTEEVVECFAAPCNPIVTSGKFYVTKPTSGHTVGRLRLVTKTDSKSFKLEVAGDGTSLKLAPSYTDDWAKYDKVDACANTATKSYVKMGASCLINFMCTKDSKAFKDACGCGCEKVAPAPCVVTGCSGQICAESSMITTCEYKASYACYKTAICERGADGTCGWRDTPELESCLESHL